MRRVLEAIHKTGIIKPRVNVSVTDLGRALALSQEWHEARSIEELVPHSIVTYYGTTGDGSPVTISDFHTVPAYHHRELYCEIFPSFGIEDQLAFALKVGEVMTRIAFEHGLGADGRNVVVIRKGHAEATSTQRSQTLHHWLGSEEPLLPCDDRWLCLK
ncbi:MAG TPA: hypothetical protein VMV52_01060 [Candidatus Nanopelagicaceae bacterium]|nr:hypothetical protein [Candidatus Nanopelagicaceae bacterium]